MQALGVSWGDRKGRRRAALAAVTATALLVPGTGFGQADARSAHASVLQQVIVQALPDALGKAEHAVAAAGGTITRKLGIVNGFSATVPSGTTLDSSDGVLAVTPDRVLRLQGSDYDPTTDAGAPAALENQTGASAYWAQGLYGQGVGVALIDSGGWGVDGLRQNVFYGPDLTPQALTPRSSFRDTYGHGTMMASIIAGRTDNAARPYSDPSQYVGIAPEANLVSVKVADALGVTTESSVVAGVDWAVQHKDDNGLNIRVINLSVGIPGRLPPRPAGRGRRARLVLRPDGRGLHRQQRGVHGRPAGSGPVRHRRGRPGRQRGGLVLQHRQRLQPRPRPGRTRHARDRPARPGQLHRPALRQHRRGRRHALPRQRHLRGDGCDRGAAALVISQHPGITPDQVKALLKSTAQPLDGETSATEGSGALDLGAAVDAAVPNAGQKLPPRVRLPVLPHPLVRRHVGQQQRLAATVLDVHRRRAAPRQQLERQHLDGQRLERQRLERLGVERQRLERLAVERVPLERKHLGRQHVEQ